MIYKSHYIELWVNGNLVELESQDSVNVRFNNVLSDPTKITSSQAEYSFEFELPCTPTNNKIFNYANDLAKLNKFRPRWDAELLADGNVIFNGTLTLNSVKDNMYKVNLVSVKNNSLDEMFGEEKMTDIKLANGEHWGIPFDGAGDKTAGYTIDYYNDEICNFRRDDVCFPLVSYGVFKKYPSGSTNNDDDEEDTMKEYTSKFVLDKYNKWFVDNFYPSISMLETMKRAFEYKGYKVGGNAFQDVFLKNIFMSVNLADGQVPDYNLGNPKFGSASLSATISTSGKTSYQQELNFPYFKVSGIVNENQGFTRETKYNFSSINIYDIFDKGNVTLDYPTYLYRPNDKVIEIPSDGFYKIEMTVSSTLNSTGNITVMQNLYDELDREMREESVSLPVGFMENTPIEIALIRNYDDNYELIKGKRNKNYVNGNPNEETYTLNHRTYSNVNDWYTCFPHEDPYNSTLPTEENGLVSKNSSQYGGRRRSDGSVSSHIGGSRSNPTRGGTIDGRGFNDGGGRRWTPAKLGYIYNDGEIMAYDQAVSTAFICGLSSFYGGVASVMKNGYSWSKMNADENQAFYPEIGYSFMTRDTETGGIVTEETQYNSNIYINTPISYVNSQGSSMNGYVSCMVWLNRGDRLELAAIHRGYTNTAGTNVYYNTTTNINFKISAASPRSYNELKAAHYAYNSPSEFDVNLNLANFFNKEKKISDWLQNTIDAFNLEVIEYGNNITINTKKKYAFDKTAVDVDEKVNSNKAESSIIEYPKSMAVKYKTDIEEWGFEKSVYPQTMLNYPDWYKYGDSGFTEIILNDDSYITSKSEKSLQYSYTWYDNFNWIAVDNTFQEDTGVTINLNIPVISKYTYMIDGYSYDESMNHDGYGLAQRFWFRPVETMAYVWTRTYPSEYIRIYKPTNLLEYGNDVLNLSYKTTEKSLLGEYFNITPFLASNYVTIEVYLNPTEYNRLKNGALCRFDKDLYEVVEIEGFDPTGGNPTTLKLMKKTI